MQDPRNDRRAPEPHNPDDSHRIAPAGRDTDAGKPKPARNYSDNVPAITLPKAGGAIRSIGEKFKFNAANGSASIAIPIAVSQARGAPALSLNYDSGSGNGPFGIGWSLDVPAIARKTDKGLPQYGRGDVDDVFTLSGAEDLVPAQLKSGNQWQVDENIAGQYRMRRFRPRCESAFARIERFENVSNPADVWWQAITKDNVRSYYGRYPQGDHPDAAARIFDSGRPSWVFSWLLSETVDAKGNRTVYEYKAEDNDGVAQTWHESRRRNNAQPQRYLKRITFGNRPTAAAAPDWAFQIVFDYGEHDTLNPRPAEDVPWPARLDAFSRYRSRFEIRTRRLCRRILCFHEVPGSNLGTGPVLTRSTDFTYDENATATRLIAAQHTGYVKKPAGTGYDPLSAPQLTFDYSQAKLDDVIRHVDEQYVRGAPQGLSGSYRFADLDGEGLSGVLCEQADGWLYKRNEGGGRFGAMAPVATRPAWAPLNSGAQIANLEGDGQPYLVAYGNLAGYAARTDDGGWTPYRPFAKRPNVDMSDPDMRHIDLDGDGNPDLVILGDEIIRWHRNEGRDGYSQEARVSTGIDEERGPARVFENNLECIFTTDMTGDGLTDIVRIRNGDVAYWPNLGFGRFGEKVVMDNPPVFDGEDQFAPSRLRLGDIDGSGTTDILYLGRNTTRYWLNQSGNRFAPAATIAAFPPADNHTDVNVVDLLGNGTGCLVWSSPLVSEGVMAWRYVDLMGGIKPYLLSKIDNGTGAKTWLSYKASTAFYLEDRRDGRPWITKLPFPVQLLHRVETEDIITGNRLISRYSYHHGYYDRPEREFRGFARVDQWDSEGVDSNSRTIFDRDPVLTRSWFHTGAWIDEQRVSTDLAGEYYAAHPGWNLPDSEIEDAASLSPKELREAKRALRGRLLRQEIYSCTTPSDPEALPVPDAVPYSVAENRYLVRRLQPANQQAPHAVFLAVQQETLTRHYERDPADPRIAHELTLDSDDYGQALLTAAVAYPRLQSVNALPEQAATYVTLNEANFINSDATAAQAWRHIGLPCAKLGWELAIAPPGARPFRCAELKTAFTAATAADPAAWPVAAGTKRLLSGDLQLYRSDAHAAQLDFAPLDFGKADALALPGPGFTLVFTQDLLTQATDQTTNAERNAQTYQATADIVAKAEFSATPLFKAKLAAVAGNGWWARDGVAAFDGGLFYAVTQARNPWGMITEIAHDARALLPVSVTQAKHEPEETTIHAQNDYRVLAPWEITDANANRQQVTFDALGRVTSIARMGKAVETVGDTLANPTVIILYADHEIASGKPNYVHSWMRETHYADLLPADRVKPLLLQCRWRETRLYSDGFGRELEKKNKTRKGDAHYVDPISNTLATTHANPRWIGTGRTLYDNKGSPVRQWEPYFSTTVDYEEEDALRQWGVTPEIHYDPLGRAVRTDFPDGSFSKVEFTPWARLDWDRNDTVIASAWYTDRGAPLATAQPPTTAQEFAAWVAAQHAGTPAIHHFDTLGRPVRSLEDNKDTAAYETRIVLDIQGNQRELWDANGNCALAQSFDLAGRPLHTLSNDAGERWLLPAADGQPAIVRSNRGGTAKDTVTLDHDALRRPTKTWVIDPGATTPRLVAELIYGETATNAQANNLFGLIYQSRDQAGLAVHDAYDFKGNPKRRTRTLLDDPKVEPDWSLSPALASEMFVQNFAADAENRTIRESAPDGAEITFAYDDGGQFKTSSVTDATGVTKVFVDDISYDAKGSRTRIAYGNGTATDYTYDAQTFRLTSLVTVNDSGGKLQDIVYTHDAVGNIVRIEDAAQPTVFTNNQMIVPVRTFRYDPLYRLTLAEGREHQAQNPGADQRMVPISVPHKADGNALRSYVQNYTYDKVGNITQMSHVAGAGNWTRDYRYDYQGGGTSNRLTKTVNPNDPFNPVAYVHDAHGNIMGLPQIGPGGFVWDHADRLREVDLSNNQRAYYGYDNAGERVRKMLDKGAITEERIYLGFYEIYRKFSNGTLAEECTTLHVMDGTRRIAMVETQTTKNAKTVAAPSPVTRYQLGDHLDSAALELTGKGDVLSYEEFHPYGTTAIYSEDAITGATVSRKRYRYSGKERDEESGLNYHSARYYMPWLGRWLSADPKLLKDGLNLYKSLQNNPMRWIDPKGTQSTDLPNNTVKQTDPKSTQNTLPSIPMSGKTIGHVTKGLTEEQAIDQFNNSTGETLGIAVFDLEKRIDPKTKHAYWAVLKSASVLPAAVITAEAEKPKSEADPSSDPKKSGAPLESDVPAPTMENIYEILKVTKKVTGIIGSVGAYLDKSLNKSLLAAAKGYNRAMTSISLPLTGTMLKVPTTIMRRVAPITKFVSKAAPVVGAVELAADIIVDRKITVANVLTGVAVAASAVALIAGAPAIATAAAVVGAVYGIANLASWIFTGKTMEEHLDDRFKEPLLAW